MPEARVPWTSGRIHGTPEPPAPYSVHQTFGNLSFKNPVEVVPEPGTDRLWVLEVDGGIYWFSTLTLEKKEAGNIRSARPDARRCYGLAFHPGYPGNPSAFLCYAGKPEEKDGTILSRLPVRDGRLDFEEEEILLRWQSGGHNGGSLKFGPDGFLYGSAGDGAAPSPPDHFNTGQDISDIMASIFRIDVDRRDPGKAYSVPADNPFRGHPGARPEIWAFGLRNPWRMSFDRKTGDLWTGDVGWELWEMVFRIERGGNYGWSIVEGSQPVRPDFKQGPAPITSPVYQHSHIEARSITGGFVYRGKRFPGLLGKYIYGDYVTGRIWALEGNDAATAKVEEIARTPLQIICFGEQEDGELLVVDYGGGIYRFERNETSGKHQSFPRRLSETGLFDSTSKLITAPGVYPYEIAAEPWFDGVTSTRHFAIPGDGKLGVYKRLRRPLGEMKGAWSFPPGTVFAKTIWLPEAYAGLQPRKIETQILHRNGEEWQAYAYIWDEDQKDALLAPAGGVAHSYKVTENGRSRTFEWRTAARSECLLCHTHRGGTIYGFNQRQLNHSISNAGRRTNLLKHIDSMGFLEEPIRLQREPTQADPYDIGADLAERAKSYLHLNCGHCHRKGGGGTAVIDLTIEEPWERMELIGTPASQGTFGIKEGLIVNPGRPLSSTLLYRMAKLGTGRMPHFGSKEVDEEGLLMMRDWIQSLKPINHMEYHLGMLDSLDRDSLTTEQALGLALAAAEASHEEKAAYLAVLQGLGRHENPFIAELFERFIPLEERLEKLGSNPDPGAILGLRGRAEEGRKVFFAEGGARCAACHKVGGEGALLGPDLSRIGTRYEPAELVRHILEPSLHIEEAYQAWDFEMDDDFVHTGFKVSETGQEIVMRDLTGEIRRLPRKDIVQMAVRPVSSMPTGLLAGMTPQQAADLIAFLKNLKDE